MSEAPLYRCRFRGGSGWGRLPLRTRRLLPRCTLRINVESPPKNQDSRKKPEIPGKKTGIPEISEKKIRDLGRIRVGQASAADTALAAQVDS